MFVAALEFELHLPSCRSLKDKRAALRPVLEGVRRRFSVSAAEVDHQNRWQRASIGVAVVGGSETTVTEVCHRVERFVWSFPELEVLDCHRLWLEEEP